MALVSYFNVAQRTHSMASFSAEYWHELDVRLSAVLEAEKLIEPACQYAYQFSHEVCQALDLAFSLSP
jgi:hypothetical protein